MMSIVCHREDAQPEDEDEALSGSGKRPKRIGTISNPGDHPCRSMQNSFVHILGLTRTTITLPQERLIFSLTVFDARCL